MQSAEFMFCKPKHRHSQELLNKCFWTIRLKGGGGEVLTEIKKQIKPMFLFKIEYHELETFNGDSSSITVEVN